MSTLHQPTGDADLGPLLAWMPRRLSPLDEGLASYLAPGSGPATITIDERRSTERPYRPLAGSTR